MDEIDRAAEGQGPSPRPAFNPENRPLKVDDEEFDEVDRPSVTMVNTPRSEPDLKIDDDDECFDDSDDTPVFEIKNDIVSSTSNGNHSDFEHIDDEPATELLDGTPTQSSEDGPFNGMFKKPSTTFQKHKEEVDHEGIVSKHTTFYPKEPKSKATQQPPPSDYFYAMDKFPRGRLTILNVKYFRRSSGMADYPRHGTDKDADSLVNLFLDLGFIVDRYDNPSRKEIMNILKVAASEDYSNMNCCACALLSHGEEGIIYGTDGYVKIKDITKLFRTRSLAGKPKFFLFQACQGSEYMNPIDSVDGPGRRAMTEEEMSLTLPSEADFIYAYSTVPGFYSWRNSKRGSWFMESLVAVFREYAHKMDVLRMLTRVNASVAHRKSRTDDRHTDDKRQIASIITQTRKDFFLCPPYGPLESHH